MPPPSKPVRQSQARVGARGKTMAAALLRFFTRIARDEAAIALGRFNKIRKISDAQRELQEIIRRFGLSQSKDSAVAAASTEGLTDIVSPGALRDTLRGKQFEIQLFQLWDGIAEQRASIIASETKTMVREAVGRIIRDATDEVPQPSNAEIARRIRSQFFGSDPEGRAFVFSQERANVIARTELAQAENTGIFQAYEVAGVEKIQWLAFTDGKSGDRHHERMNKKTIKVGETFRTPLGNDLRFPADPQAPIADTANCRCTHRAIVE
jgi:hypothetical protein